MLNNIESNTKGEELKKNPVGDDMKSKKTILGKTPAFDGNELHKASEKSLSQQFNTPSGHQRSVLNGYFPRVLEVRTGDYSTHPAGGKYPALVEYLKRYPYFAKWAQLEIHLLARVISHVKHQIY